MLQRELLCCNVTPRKSWTHHTVTGAHQDQRTGLPSHHVYASTAALPHCTALHGGVQCFHTFLSVPAAHARYAKCQNFTLTGQVWITHGCYFSTLCYAACRFIDVQHLLTARCSLLVSPGPRHYRTAARLGSHEPPAAQRWPGSTRLSLPPWAGHLGREGKARKESTEGGKGEETERGKWKCDVR